MSFITFEMMFQLAKVQPIGHTSRLQVPHEREGRSELLIVRAPSSIWGSPFFNSYFLSYR
jgi:hypothetical protein